MPSSSNISSPSSKSGDFPPRGGHETMCAYAAGISSNCTCATDSKSRCTCGNAAYEQMYDYRVPCRPDCELKQTGGAS